MNRATSKPPFVWNEDRRLHLRAKLDAVFFHLYGITDRDDLRYIYSTFPHRRTPGNRHLWLLPLARLVSGVAECAGGGGTGRRRLICDGIQGE